MRWRPLLWLCVSVLCFLGAYYFWRLGDEWAAQRRGAKPAQGGASPTSASLGPSQAVPLRLLSTAGALNSVAPRDSAAAKPTKATEHRLSNTTRPLKDLIRSGSAILLENALIDTASGKKLEIPDQLRAHGDPGAYIVQSRKPLDDAFRAMLREAGAAIVSYIPNNAYLVRASAAAANSIAAQAGTQAVLPYEPYYKLKPALLKQAVEQTGLVERGPLNVLVFADGRDSAREALGKLGVPVTGEEPSPFGPVFQVEASGDRLALLAGLPQVQEIEPGRVRVLANDLSRVRVGESVDTLTASNYLNLGGTNIMVAMADYGVDALHPDLANRVFFDTPISGVDSNGHGTHVAGIIASSGASSTTPVNVGAAASGSVSNADFRGRAPGAKLFSMSLSSPDWYLQQRAAQTNALISNNGWVYASGGYDLAAASYDAAVRDALPMVTGSQPVLFVFAAGNNGGGSDDGLSGQSDTIASPATAKNVLTVGAVEQFRNITNEVITCVPDPTSTNGVTCTTNKPWELATDSLNEVAAYSSRGNVGIGIEGDHGRFKPDLVAPGTFVVSTRSTEWDQAAYYDPNTHYTNQFVDQVDPNGFNNYSVFVPDNAVLVRISVTAQVPLPIYVRQDDNPTVTNYTILRTNVVTLPGDAPLNPVGTIWFYSIADTVNYTVPYVVTTEVVSTNSNGPYFQALSNLNSTLGPFYRYESGTSMAAAEVAGTLALLQEFFEVRLKQTNSPALMKALLINGARSANSIYDLEVNSTINFQGWGMISLPNTIPPSLSNATPAGASAKLLFDQSPTNALATGDQQTRLIDVSTNATAQPLRVTVVWTDPPGNPAASIKLVNDLDLVVTNLDTGEIYFGNDIKTVNNFNQPWDTNTAPPLDAINNVENVYIPPPLGSHYSVTVFGRAVNVNAVAAHTNNVVQDYAMVISSGSGTVTNALTLRDPGTVTPILYRNVTFMTNQFAGISTETSGGLLMYQHVGANTPLLGTNTLVLPDSAGAQLTLGMTNQWHFYVISNDLNFTNAAFVTFLPPTLALPRMGVTNVNNPENASRIESDIDLYVSTDPNLTNLVPAAVDAALKSLSRGGTEVITISNAIPAGTYYIGVKSEDQQAAEYGFLALFSQNPFTENQNGNFILRGLPVPAYIPDGTPSRPGAVIVFGFCTQPIEIRRVVITNIVTHENFGDLLGNFSHAQKFAVLNNHTFPPGTPPPLTYEFIYEDNGEGNVAFSQHTDGPGSLTDFIGEQGVGVWMLAEVDNAFTHTGRVDQLMVKLEPHNIDPGGAFRDIPPNTFSFDYVDVPADATNLQVCVTGNNLPMELYVRKGALPTRTEFDYFLPIAPPGDCLNITPFDTPPLTPGRYYIGAYNPNNVGQRVRLYAIVTRNPGAVQNVISTATGLVPIGDDAITYAYITNRTHLTIDNLDVGLLINHPRISDLAITLISPNGTRLLLFEDRGAQSPYGLGSYNTGAGFTQTNLIPFYTNDFQDAAVGPYSAGTFFSGWNVLSNYAYVYPELPAPWLSNNVAILGYSAISNSLPTTNSTAYALSFKVTHAPYLVGTIGWWPFEGDGSDVFGGFDGLLSGNVHFNTTTGEVNRAFFGDGLGTRMVVPRAPELNVGLNGRGFSIEGWINPASLGSSLVTTGLTVMADGFDAAQAGLNIPAGSHISGWLVESGNVDVFTTAQAPPDAGTQSLDLNGSVAGVISTNINLAVGQTYLLSFAYTKNPNTMNPSFVANARISITGQPDWLLSYAGTNTAPMPNWFHTSRVFTASSPVTKLTFTSLNVGNGGMYLDTVSVTQVAFPSNSIGQPLVEWFDTGSTNTNVPLAGVQFWLSGLPGTNGAPGSLWANIPETNGTPHIFFTPVGPITNNGWQHVALTYDSASGNARIYTNGQPAALQVLPNAIVPKTVGDLYFAWHPGESNNFAGLQGGLDEAGLYNRALSDCEVLGIFNASTNGKSSPLAISCPVTNSVQLTTSFGTQTYKFNNGLLWTKGPVWETNLLFFNNQLISATNGGAGTNLSSIVVSSLDPNTTVDEFVLSAVLTNQLSGQLHFTEDTNRALVPIKFAPWPYALSNFPPVEVFSNSFAAATQGVYTVGRTLPGIVNDPAVGQRDWTVVAAPVTVITNSLVDAGTTNALALADGGVQCLLPTTAGRRYRLSYDIRGPGAVSWWPGDSEPLSQRAWDLIGGNNGAFLNGATNVPGGLVTARPAPHTLQFPSSQYVPTNPFPALAYSARVDVGDPVNLRLTNNFTFEGWIRPDVLQTNFNSAVGTFRQMLLFRGDSRSGSDPYFLALDLDPATTNQYDLTLHIDGGQPGTFGTELSTTNFPVKPAQWQHVAAILEGHVPVPGLFDVKGLQVFTNQMRLYVNGVCLASNYTAVAPFRDLDPSYSPGVAIGNRSRLSLYSNSDTDARPFIGFIDELSVYGRVLTDPEIQAIVDARQLGKADFRVPPAAALAKARVTVDNVELDLAYGDNALWNHRAFEFTAIRTNAVLLIRSLLPGTLIDGVTLTELPAELNYKPEESLTALNGEDGYGVWKLEIWDTRAGGGTTNDNPMLVDWQLNFTLQPSNPPPVIHLEHGIPYTNRLVAFGVQNFIVDVPQWATNATNVLVFASDRTLTNPLNLGVLYDTNAFPSDPANAVFWPPVSSGTKVISTNPAVQPFMYPGQSYYLTVTNPNPVGVTFAYGVWFDILTLTNCEPLTNFVWKAGVPRYFQFDVPTNALPPGATLQEVSFWLTGARSNLTVVLSQHLPLPDLVNFDYISAQPSTNDEVLLMITNTTPFAISSNRWYVGVFNSADTNVPFQVQMCYQTLPPAIIGLTNGVPYVAGPTNPYVAPPGPPQTFFFLFEVTNSTDAVLFELYNLSGNADLVLQRETVPGMAPYYDGSFRVGSGAEQIVLRTTRDVPDLRGYWYLGVFNNEKTNVTYTIRAVTQDSAGFLLSGQPIQTRLTTLPLPHGLFMQWNAVAGESYVVEFSPSLRPANWTFYDLVTSTTPLATYEIKRPLPNNGLGFYRVRQVSRYYFPSVTLTIQVWTNNTLRISWPTAFPNETLQFSTSPAGPWANVLQPVTVEGTQFVVYDPIGPVPKYYRLIP